MNKFISKLAKLFLGISMAAGVGVAFATYQRAKSVEAADSYEKLTAAPSDWSGEYLLAYDVSATSAKLWTGVDTSSSYVSATVSSNKITSVPNGAVSLIIASMTGGYSVKVKGGTNDGKYISGTSGSNKTNFDTTECLNTFSYNSGVLMTSNTSVMRFNNSTSNGQWFRYYKSSSYTNQKVVQLYKKASIASTYTVNYYLNNSSASGSVPSSVSNLSSNDIAAFDVAAVPNNFNLFGYKCDGWATSASGAVVYSASGAEDQDLTSLANSNKVVNLYAHWEPKTFEGFDVQGSPDKTSYDTSEEFDPTGITHIYAKFDVSGTPTTDTSVDLLDQVSWDALSTGTTATGTVTVSGVSQTVTIEGLIITGPIYSYSFSDWTWSGTKGTVYSDRVEGSTGKTWRMTAGEYFTYSSQDIWMLGDYNSSKMPWATFSTNKYYSSIANAITSASYGCAMYTNSFSINKPEKVSFSWTATSGIGTSATSKGYILASTNGGYSWTSLQTQNDLRNNLSITWEPSSNPLGDSNNVLIAFAFTSTTNNSQLRNMTIKLYGESLSTTNVWAAREISNITGGNTVEAEQSVSLSASVVTQGYETPANTNITWESTDESVATVSSTGVVTGVADGTCKIKAIAADGNGAFKEIDFSVTPKLKRLGTISLNTDNVTKSFVRNSTFNYTGLVVTAHYANGFADEIVTPTSVSTPNMSIAGNKTVTVTYTINNTSASETYNIEVTPIISDSITISGEDISFENNRYSITTLKETMKAITVSWNGDEESITSSPNNESIYYEDGVLYVESTGNDSGTIEFTVGNATAYLDVTVIGDPILTLLDANDNNIDGLTLNYFTGDTPVMIRAVSENVDSPVYKWTTEDDGVVTIDEADDYCEVTIVGAGSSEVSVTVGALTRTVTFSVTQSAVTSLTLTSSVPSGQLYDGTYKNTLTLTPAVTLVGNATGLIKWSSSDTDVATISNTSTTAPTGITVTGVGVGTATIKAESVYSPSMSETFDVTVTADGVNSLSWTKRPKFNSSASGFQTIWAGESTLGDLMSQNGSDGIGVFAPTWESSKSDSPTMGTGAHNVHIGLYDTGSPSEETTPLTSSYVFTAADNGKYVVAFYEGKASIQNTQLSVTNWRSVVETATYTGTYDFTTATGTGALSSLGDYYSNTSTLKEGTYSLTAANNESSRIKIGSNNNTGRITITLDEGIVITSVTVVAKSYGDASTVISVMGNEYSALRTDNWSTLTYTLAKEDFDETNVFSIEMNANKKRAYIQSIVIQASGSQQIGKESDCLGLESFIDTNLHMSDYTASAGWCNDDEHHYYSTAKAAYNSLNTHQKSLFVGNSAYAAEYARLSAWAAANGESFNAQNSLASGIISPLVGVTNSGNTVAIIVIITMVSVTAIGGYFFLRKRKENN